ncbi:MAG: DNA endonuclease SmrA [Methylococcaceae bacterium]|nr:DNA endonuclease SmrA [Methylococcaceae bacterium]
MADDDDSALFQQEMADVTPIKTSPDRPRATKVEPTPGQLYRREAAQRARDGSGNFLPANFIEPVDPQAELSFKRQGIQQGVFHSLQQGRYPIEATLDLHLMSIEEAREQVYEFIHDCCRLDVRTALITHGKGQRAILKSCVARWLPMFPEVMAFHSAQRFHGGTGAVYVLLRKSAKQKEQTLEKLGLKSGKPQP